MDDKEYKKLIDSCMHGTGSENYEKAIDSFRNIIKAGAPLPRDAQEWFQTVLLMDETIKALYNSDTYKAITKAAGIFSEILQESKPTLDAITAAPDRVKDLALFISEALQESSLSDRYTLIDVIEKGFDEDGNTIQDGPFTEIIKQAEKQLVEVDKTAGLTVDNTASDFFENLPLLLPIKPERHIMPNNTLMNELSGITGKEPINAGEYDLPVMYDKKKHRDITVYVMAMYEPEEGITSNLTEYERDVSDAIMSIWEQAKKDKKPATFTVDSLYRAMPGRGERAGEQQKEEITKAVEKFLHLYIDVDATDELRRRGTIGNRDTYHVKDYYLRAQEHTYKAQGGQPVRAWLMSGEPLMLSYSKLTSQILSIPAKYLAIEKVKKGKASGEILRMDATR